MSEQPVEAKAESTIHISPEVLRRMFDAAMAFCPVCSMKMKKISQVKMEKKLCIIVQSDTFRMERSIPGSKRQGVSRP